MYNAAVGYPAMPPVDSVILADDVYHTDPSE